ncbi:MAG: phospholipase D-like domain-containing protein, partial [Candidatus Micrarchaeales archaeon]
DNARTLRIISPYLGISYARMLLKVSKRKKVFLIVSGDSKKKDEDAVKLIAKRGRRLSKNIILYLLLGIAISAIAGLYTISICFALILVLLVYLNLVYNPKGRRIEIKIATDKFIHEKLYLSDRNAIVGSANLTYSGTHKNIEHIEMIKNESRIKELGKHFDELWNRY